VVLGRKLPVGIEHPYTALLEAASHLQPEVALEGATVAELDHWVPPMETNALDVKVVINRARDLAEQDRWLALALGHQDPLTALLKQAIPVDLRRVGQLAEQARPFAPRPRAAQVEIGHT
jgi:hypothetical protein